MSKLLNRLTTLLLISWIILVTFFYLKFFPHVIGKSNVVLNAILCCLILVILCLLAGNKFLKIFRLNDISILDEILFSASLGIATLSMSIYALGLIQAFSPWALGSLLIGFCIIAFTNYAYVTLLWHRAKTWHPTPSLPELVIILLIFTFFTLTLLNTLTPPCYRDALIHHLAIPKWYIRHHGIVDISFASFSYYPPLMEMLYTGALLLSSDIFAQLIHFLFYFGTLLFTYSLAKNFLSSPMSLLAVLLFGSLPVVCQVSSIAYSDLGLTFFTVAGLLSLLHWKKNHNQAWFCLGALMVGFAVGCKYNGAIVLFSLLPGVFFTLAQWKVPLQKLAKNIVIFLLMVFLVNALWLGRNFWHTGNPVFPLASSFIGEKAFTHQPALSPYERRKLLYGETLRDQLLLPWNLSVMTQTKGRLELDGVINPIFLIFLPFFIFVSPKPLGIKWIAYVSLLYFLFFWASSVVRLRYLMPIYPLMGILTAFIAGNLDMKWKKALITITLGAAFLLNLFWVLRYTGMVNPINFMVGEESREEFLSRRLPSYPVYEYANAHLPPTAKIMFLYGGNFGNDGYYLDHDYFFDSQYLGSTVKNILKQSLTTEEVRNEFVRLKITHLLINEDLLHIDFSSSLPDEKLLLYESFCQKYLSLEFKHAKSSLYRVK